MTRMDLPGQLAGAGWPRAAEALRASIHDHPPLSALAAAVDEGRALLAEIGETATAL